MLVRRHPGTHALKTYLCHGPADLPLDTRVWLTGMRWPMETCFQEGKQWRGLGDYEGRSWIGWHHYMTLCLRAHCFLVRQKLRLKKSPGPDRTPGMPLADPDFASSPRRGRPCPGQPGLSGPDPHRRDPIACPAPSDPWRPDLKTSLQY